ncbi:hypothetical protein [Trinickia dabaoshanensis]|uniref:hypothetical protein n=1 Tax=Trinickia dabaoshanensis TaxID=564714 RepID=UPI001E652207|nr:hypothetical protein [Trinickia dabaoshanensis]
MTTILEDVAMVRRTSSTVNFGLASSLQPSARFISLCDGAAWLADGRSRLVNWIFQ